jgi:hypothetical protein
MAGAREQARRVPAYPTHSDDPDAHAVRLPGPR